MVGLRESFKDFTSAFTGPKVAQKAPVLERMAEGTKDFVMGLGKNTVNAQPGVLSKTGAVIADVLWSPFRVLGGIGKASWFVGGGVTKAAARGTAVAGAASAKVVGSGVLEVAKQPVAGMLKISASGVRAARRHPIIAGLLVGVPALFAGLKGLQSRAEQRTQDELLAQITLPPQGPYMNSASQAEVDAALAARAQQGDKPVSHVANLEQQAAAQAQAAAR